TYINLMKCTYGLRGFTARITYLQILKMKKASELVKHTLQVYNAIGDLTTHYSQAQSEEFREELLKTGGAGMAFKNYREEGQIILNSLKTLTSDNEEQLARLDSFQVLLEIGRASCRERA